MAGRNARPTHGTDGAAPFGYAQGGQVRALQADHSADPSLRSG